MAVTRPRPVTRSAPRREASPGPALSRGLRPEIQALRAVAVGLVVAFHLWPEAVPGGFLGVDVFFAISGFLITMLLLREARDTRRVSLTGFWARRIRRILPAAFVVLAAVAVATLTLVPENNWSQYLREVRASTLYVQNWQLAHDAVDYFAAANQPSPVQHFWSLSVEEQFYLVWPVMIALAALVARNRLRAAAIGMGVLTVASFVYSVVHTAADQADAYFVTPTRAWEFGLGGLLAGLPVLDATHVRLRAAVSWLGLAAIVTTALTYSVRTPFPGWAAAIPVGGAVAVMWAGMPAVRWAPSALLALRPVQFLGNISYSVYLWHWPLLILAPFVLDHAVHATDRIVILMLTLLIAWLSKIAVEDPVRSGRLLLGRRLRWTFAFALVGALALTAVTAFGNGRLQQQIRHDQQVTRAILSSKPRCFGAASRDAAHPCHNPALDKRVVPTPVEAKTRPNAPCNPVEHRANFLSCSFGTAEPRAKGEIALIGDSHASHWRSALRLVAQDEGWHGTSVTHTGCAYSRAIKDLPEPDRSRCISWVQSVPRWLRKHPEIDTVFVSNIASGSWVVRRGVNKFQAVVDGYRRAWAAFPSTVRHIVVIRDTPKVRGDTDTCIQRALARHQKAGLVCAVPRSESLDAAPAAAAAQRDRTGRVQLIDMTSFICDARLCYPVIGGALVFKDQNHITLEYGETLAPYLRRKVDALKTSW